jgi:hypothetical protein
MIINKIKNVLERFKDNNLHSEAAREVIAISIYEELLDELNKEERGL